MSVFLSKKSGKCQEGEERRGGGGGGRGGEGGEGKGKEKEKICQGYEASKTKNKV